MSYDKIKRHCRDAERLAGEDKLAEAHQQILDAFNEGASNHDIWANMSRDAMKKIQAWHKTGGEPASAATCTIRDRHGNNKGAGYPLAHADDRVATLDRYEPAGKPHTIDPD